MPVNEPAGLSALLALATVPSLPELLDLAERAALGGGEVVLAGRSGASAERKGAGDYVTEVDRASERAIREVPGRGSRHPRRRRGGWGRAGGALLGGGPLDGTTNYLHGFPVVGVSVALVVEGSPVVGVVHAPFQEETYLAARGQGARLRRGAGEAVAMTVSDRSPDRAVVGTGFPFRHKDSLPRYLAAFEGCLERFEDLRRPGAAALDLAWVAAGVFEGFFELGLSPWDVAAGALLIEEAGGVVTDWEGGPGYLSGDVLAGNPAVHAALLDIARRG